MSPENEHQTSRARTPKLPPPGWMPDPSVTGLERFWDGSRWTGRTRDRHTRVENPPPANLTYAPRSWTPAKQRRRWRPGRRFGITLVLLVGVATAYQYANAGGYLPQWATPQAIIASLGEPSGPAVDYPTYGSTELVAYLERGMVAQESSIDVTYWMQTHGFDGISDALLEAATQNPYIFVQAWETWQDGGMARVRPTYTYDDAEAERRRAATQQAAADALVASGAQAAATDADRVTAIHDFIVSTATYDVGAFEQIRSDATGARVDQSQEAYGILVMGTAVCNGYAQAFQVMAEQAGLDAVIVTGSDSAGATGGSHAWNKVNVDGRWVLVDTTWDDPIGMAGWGEPTDDVIYRDYLMVPDGDPLLSTRVTGMEWVVDENRQMFGA